MSFSAARAEAGLTLDEVSRSFGASPAAVHAWEEGSKKPPPHVVRSLELLRGGALPTPAHGVTPRQPEFEATRDEGPLFKSEKLIRSKQRVADHAEVFTPAWLVEKMLDLVKDETERIDARFLEPACGSGNFLVPILQRKLAAVEVKYGRTPFERQNHALQALTCCYGIELLADNIAECRANMLAVFAQYLALDEGDDLYRAASEVLSVNLIHGDAMTMKNVDDGAPILIVEWGYLGRGKFQRRDFRLDVMTGRGELFEDTPLFRQPETVLERHGVFVPVAPSYPPMTVRALAARDAERRG